MNSSFHTPLSNFVDYDFAELTVCTLTWINYHIYLQQQELKKKSDKAKYEYDAALVRINGSIRKKHDSHNLAEVFFYIYISLVSHPITISKQIYSMNENLQILKKYGLHQNQN